MQGMTLAFRVLSISAPQERALINDVNQYSSNTHNLEQNTQMIKILFNSIVT